MADFTPLRIDPVQFERALARLTRLQRDAFLLRTREGLAYAEIGELLGLTATAVEACVVSALIKLDVELARTKRPWWRFW